MENEQPKAIPSLEDQGEIKQDPEFKKFATRRIIVGILVAVALIWGAAVIIDFLDKPSGKPLVVATHSETGQQAEPASHGPEPATDAHAPAGQSQPPPMETKAPKADHGQPAASKAAASAAQKETAGHGQEAAHEAPSLPVGPPGVAFTEALIGPLNHEVNERFWGWRPNDIINVTDNINNIQLGILEVTRRATIELTEKISRTGSTASFDPHLERAMNWLMVKATEYWFPSAETKYKDALGEMKLYQNRLRAAESNFFTRADNLIPLLAVFEDLLGSCDENLVKQFEDDGRPVSHFMADDYFYYAQGVAMAMLPLMEAVAVDFRTTLENRNGLDVAHHAIHSLTIATEIQPWYITEADLDGILANHRANIAAPISHARFYMSVLINTLST